MSSVRRYGREVWCEHRAAKQCLPRGHATYRDQVRHTGARAGTCTCSSHITGLTRYRAQNHSTAARTAHRLGVACACGEIPSLRTNHNNIFI